MHLTDVAHAPCLNCGQGNTPDNNRNRKKFVDLERDVNWNEPVLLCEDCVILIGSVVGMATESQMNEKDAVIRAREQDIHQLKSDLQVAERKRRDAIRRARALEVVAS